MSSVKSRPESAHAIKSKALLQRYFGSPRHQNHYITGYDLPNARQLAVDRCGQGFYLWSEPCSDRAPAQLRGALRRRYKRDDPRNADLNDKTADRLKRGRAADYWLFPTLGDLDAFVAWYKTL